MNPTNTNDPATIALRALAWTLGESARAERLLSLTGLDADALRTSAGSRATLSAVLGFLASHEPDLIACAADLDLTPAALIAAQQELDA